MKPACCAQKVHPHEVGTVEHTISRLQNLTVLTTFNVHCLQLTPIMSSSEKLCSCATVHATEQCCMQWIYMMHGVQQWTSVTVKPCN